MFGLRYTQIVQVLFYCCYVMKGHSTSVIKFLLLVLVCLFVKNKNHQTWTVASKLGKFVLHFYCIGISTTCTALSFITWFLSSSIIFTFVTLQDKLTALSHCAFVTKHSKFHTILSNCTAITKHIKWQSTV